MVGLVLALGLSVAAQDSNVLISLERTACLGSCPIYRVTIDGDGTVMYEGSKNVRVKGSAVVTFVPFSS